MSKAFLEKGRKFAVVADDFTGANDTGVQFRKQGLQTIILTDVQNLDRVMGLFDVVVVDTESRCDEPKLAYTKVREAVRALKGAGVEVVYKKVDSTLRGNVGSELDAVMDETGTCVAFIAPAFPSNGRTTVGGYQLVEGVPVSKTEFAHDPFNPVKESHLPTLLREQTRRNVGYVALETVMQGNDTLRKEFLNQIKDGNEVIVVDAVTQEDLRTIAIALTAPSPLGLACGSAGFAEELPKAFGYRVSYPVLIVVGSVSPVSRRQVAKVREVLNAQVVELNPCRVLIGGEAMEEELRRVVGEALKFLDKGCDVVVTSAFSEESVARVRAKALELGVKDADVGKAVSNALGSITDNVVERGKIAGVILSGGGTAIEVCKAMAASGTIPEDEVQPGTSVARLVGGKHEGLSVVMKAGGFGGDDVLIKAVEYLRRRFVI